MKQVVETANAAANQVSVEAAAMFRSDQAREHLDAPCRDDEVVVATAKALAAALYDAQPPPLSTIIRRQLIEMDHAVRGAVNGPIDSLRGHVVQQHDSRIVAGEVVLQGQNFPSITQ